MLNEFADFGVVECDDAEGYEICKKLNKTHGLYYFPAGSLTSEYGKVLT
jgi:hypothetical protein